MKTLTRPMKTLIRNFNAGSVATVNADGTPAVSPKATFVIVNDKCIAFGNIRSPGTLSNLRARPAIEINFIDVLTRRAVRVAGTAEVVAKTSAKGQQLQPHFEALWQPYLETMEEFVSIAISRTELLLSPAYDLGHTASELSKANIERMKKLL